jgi:hypothetical protein
VKIKEVVDLLGLENEYAVPFHFITDYQFENKKASICSTQQGIVCDEEETIWSLGATDGEHSQADVIKTDIQHCIGGLDERDMDKYLAVTELLLAIDSYQGGKGRVELRKAEEYVSRIDAEIRKSLDFRDIEGMDALIKWIRWDRVYRQLCFRVSVFPSTRAEHRQVETEKIQTLNFGNTMYCEALDIVYITIYEDGFELYCVKEGTSWKDKFDKVQVHTTEERIMCALYYWRNMCQTEETMS